ncbi:3-hydroxyacyl-ACP dehydratase FabZ, partial [Bacillus velezensis]
MLDTQQIKEIIPHRYPFLLVDRITEVEVGKRAAGYKNVTANEDFFNGHFPEYPVMPGVLIVEALAQVGAVAMLIKEENRGRLAFFAGIDNCRFKKQVKPGDKLELEVDITRARGTIGRGKGVAVWMPSQTARD